LDLDSLLVSIIGTALTILLVYYGLRTLKLFKANIAARAWTYISISAVLFAAGVVTFILDAVQPMGVVPIGGIMQTVGAVFLVLGLRKNYMFWASKDHFA
jgi:hypothetical protein